MNRARHTLAVTRMAAAAVRPVERPELLARAALLQQELIVLIKNEQREGAVQGASARVAGCFVEMPDFSIRLVYQNQLVGLSCRQVMFFLYRIAQLGRQAGSPYYCGRFGDSLRA